MSDLAPAFRQQYFDANGLPLAGGLVYTYAAGTTTPLATYTDETGLTPNTNPVVLDSSGSASIWINAASYKFVLENSTGSVIRTVDNISNPSSASGVSSFNTLTGAVVLAAGSNVTLTPVGNTITVASTGGGGGAAWGAITGTLSSQTDLNTALGLKAPLASPTFTGTVTLPTTAGILKSSSGGVVSDATSGTDYSAGTSALGTGIVKSTTSTGALTIAIAADFPTLNQSTSGNAATVTTNANLTGPITSSGNATSVAAQTGTGTTFVMQATPTLTTPVIGAATGTSLSVSGQLTSTVATGTAPLVVSSTTPVANLVAANINGTTNATLTTASALTSVGTIATGTWNATAIGTAKGGTGQTSVITAPTASTYAGWDANKNFSANALIPGFTTTATAAGTTTMTIASTGTQFWTGVTTQTVKLPTTSIVAGAQYLIENRSTGVVTVQSSGANTITTLSTNTGAIFTALVATPTTAANWDFVFTPSIAGSSSGNIWTSTGATSAPTWQAPSGSSPTGSYAHAYFGPASSWATTSSTYADPTNTGGNTLTSRVSSGISLAAESASGNHLPAVVFTPASSSAVYLIWAQAIVYMTAAGGGTNMQMTDGTIVISQVGGMDQAAGAPDVLVVDTIGGIYAPGTASAVTVKLQLLAAGGGGTAQLLALTNGNVIEWTVLRIF